MFSPLRFLAIAGLAATGGAATPALSVVAVANPVVRSSPPDGAVLSLSILPASRGNGGTGGTDVVIGYKGEVTTQDFTLAGPNRIVVDITGATLSLPVGSAYDRVGRGGVTDIRYSQFKANIVRVALYLDAPHSYKLTRKNGEVHIAVDGAPTQFAAWKVGTAASLASINIPEDAHPVVASPAAEPPLPVEARSDAGAVAAASIPVSVAVAPLVVAPLVVAPPPVVAPPVAESTRVPVTVLTKMAPPVAQQSQQKVISISADNQNIMEIIRTISAFSGRNIVPVRAVAGNYTGDITAPWDVALRAILNSMGYDAYTNADNIIMVDTQDAIAQRAATQPLQTRQVRLNYAKAASVQQMVDKRLTRDCPKTGGQATAGAPQSPAGGEAPPSGAGAAAPSLNTVAGLNCPKRGDVQADSLSNSILITDLPSYLDQLEQYAKSLDLRPAQVNLKAKIILVDRTSLEGLGLRYDLGSKTQFFNDIVPRTDSTGATIGGTGQIALGGNMLSAIANATERVPGATVQLIYSTAMGGFDFTSFIEALQQTSVLDLQGEPDILVLNNHKANLTAGTEVPIRQIDAGSLTSGAGAAKATTTVKQVGVILDVTPQITNNRQIVMHIHLENSDVQNIGTDALAFPKQSLDNDVIVADGETAVLGGLTQTSVTSTKSGIPFLIDLPIIGRLFGVTQHTETKRDLLLLITPHIQDEGQQSVTPPGGGNNPDRQ